MARRVYFAFHYQNDISRVNIVRNSWVTQDRDAAGFYDASLWEKSKKSGDAAIQRMIDKGLERTTVTVFLLGTETAGRPWVRYELKKSFENGSGLLGVRIHDIKDFNGRLTAPGQNILDRFCCTDLHGRATCLSQVYRTYDWVRNDGYRHFGEWVEEAARIAGR